MRLSDEDRAVIEEGLAGHELNMVIVWDSISMCFHVLIECDIYEGPILVDKDFHTYKAAREEAHRVVHRLDEVFREDGVQVVLIPASESL